MKDPMTLSPFGALLDLAAQAYVSVSQNTLDRMVADYLDNELRRCMEVLASTTAPETEPFKADARALVFPAADHGREEQARIAVLREHADKVETQAKALRERLVQPGSLLAAICAGESLEGVGVQEQRKAWHAKADLDHALWPYNNHVRATREIIDRMQNAYAVLRVGTRVRSSTVLVPWKVYALLRESEDRALDNR